MIGMEKYLKNNIKIIIIKEIGREVDVVIRKIEVFRFCDLS